MSVTNIRDQLLRDEGSVPYAYKDSLGYLTIGVGHLIDHTKGGHLPQPIVESLLDWDIKQKHDELDRLLPWWEKLDDARKGVILNMAFNLGVAGLLGFHGTLGMIEQGAYSQAADAMLASKWATQVGPRATRLAQQMRSGEWV